MYVAQLFAYKRTIFTCKMCFITAVSGADASTGHVTRDGAGSFKTHSVYCRPNDFEQSRQPSCPAAVVNNSDACHGKGGNFISAAGNCSIRDASQDLLHGMSHHRQMTDKDNCWWDKQHPGSLKNQMQLVAGNCEMSAAATKLHSRSFGDLEQWLQNGEDDIVGNYIDRRVVESVLKCRQFQKQFPEKKSNSQLSSHRLNCVTNISRVDGHNNGCHEAGQQSQCQPSVADNLYQEFDGKLETEVDGDSGFSGDRNSASSTSSGLSVDSSLTSLASATDFWSGNQSSSGSATSVVSVDQTVIQPSAPVSNIPGPLPSRTTSLSNVSSSSVPQVVPDVQSNRLVSEQIYESLSTVSRWKSVEQSSRCCNQPDIPSLHNQEPQPSATNSGWCSSDEF